MAVVQRINPETGQEEIVEVPEPQAQAPQVLQAPEVPQIGAEEPTRALDIARAQDQTLSLPALEGMPPVRDVSTLESKKRPAGPGFLERMGGPSEQQLAGRGFWDTVGQFVSSDLGRNMIGALGVGLAGIRNPRDGGALQNYLMQTTIQGARERAAARQQGEAMGGLWEGFQQANGLIAQGDYAGASKVLTPLAKNPSVLRSPAAMSVLMNLQSDLTRRISGQRGRAALAAGPEIMSARELLAQKDVDEETLKTFGPMMMKEMAPKFQLDAERGMAILMYPNGKVVAQKYGSGQLPLRLKDLNALADPDTTRHLLTKLADAGATAQEFIEAYNGEKGPDLQRQAIGILAWSASQPKAAGAGSEAERTAAALEEEDRYVKTKQPVPAEVKRRADDARRVLANKERIARAAGEAGALGRQEAGRTKSQGEANRFFFDRHTMEKAPGHLTVGELEKNPKYVEVEPNQAMNISQTSSGLTIATELADLIKNNRDIFPEKLTDVNRKTALAYFMPDTAGRFDPRVARMQTLALAIPNLIRALGDTANIAVAERQITQSGLGLRVMSRSAAEASLKTLVSILNNSLRKRGFEGININELLAGESEDARLREILGVK